MHFVKLDGEERRSGDFAEVSKIVDAGAATSVHYNVEKNGEIMYRFVC